MPIDTERSEAFVPGLTDENDFAWILFGPRQARIHIFGVLFHTIVRGVFHY